MVVVRGTVVGCLLAGSVAASAIPRLPFLPRAALRAVLESSKASPSVHKSTLEPMRPGLNKHSIGTNWLDSNIFKRVELRGSRELGFHMEQVSGDAEAYNLDNYYGNGNQHFTNTGQMTVTGNKVLGMFNFQMQFSDQRYFDPESQRVTLDYDKGPVRFSAGDIRGTMLNTNPLANMQRAMKGVSTEVDTGRLKFKVVRSQAKGSAHTVSIDGNNTSGPYYLQSGRIVSDSLQVQVNGQTMKLGEDYVVDLDSGTLTFLHQVIAPTSVIVASFESYGFGTEGGTLQGAAASYDFGKLGRLGLTALEQTGTGLGVAGTILDQQSGSGQPDDTFFLQAEPLPGTLEVRVDGIIQVQGPPNAPGGDYYIPVDIPYAVRFKRIVPFDARVDFRYRPRQASNLDGDRRVWGLDYRLTMGKAGYVQYSQATGTLLSESNPMSGLARQLDGQYKLGKFSLHGTVKDVPPTFVSMETAGFNRNERSTDLGVDYEAGRYHWGIDNNNSSVATWLSGPNGTVVPSPARTTALNAFARYSDPGGVTWNLTHQRLYSNSTSENRIDTTAFTGTRKFGKLETTLGTQIQDGTLQYFDGTKLKDDSVHLRGFTGSLRYAPTDSLALQADSSINRIESQGKDSTGSDITLGAQFKPAKSPWSLTTRFTKSDSGALTSIGGLSSGFGLGYGGGPSLGNGFTGGAVGDGLLGNASSSYQQLEVMPTYKPSDRITMNAHAYQTRSQGELSSNSSSTSFGLGLDWDLGKYTIFSGSIDRTLTDFLGEVLGSTSDSGGVTGRTTFSSFAAQLQGSPPGPWAYSLGFMSQLSSGNSAFSQDSFSLNGSLSYRLAPRQRVGTEFRTGRSTGLYGQDEGYLSTYYSYSIVKGIALVGSYRIHRVANLSDNLSNGAYRSSGFNIELSLDFAP